MNAKTKRMKRGTAMLLSMLMTFSSANLQTFAWGGGGGPTYLLRLGTPKMGQ